MTAAEKPGILFVDDEKNFLTAIQRVLWEESYRWDLYFAGSVDEALAELKVKKIDLVVTDVKMPGRDGFDLLTTVKENPATSDLPVVVLTGSAESESKSRALLLGASDLLNKPIDAAELIARIQNTIKLKQYQDQIKNQNRILEEKVRERTAELEDARLDILWRLAKAGEQRDDDTGNHVVRVANYCRILAGRLGLSDEHTHIIFLTSPLHDIGKIGISDRILLKRGKLTKDQKETMKKHCQIGSNILLSHPGLSSTSLAWDNRAASPWKPNNNPLLNMAASMAFSHHEWWDGSGYPQGLAGEAIPLEGRIVAIADVYDALRSARVYKPAYSLEETMKIMRSEAKRHFDPGIFSVFEGTLDEFNAIWDRSFIENSNRTAE